MLSNNSYQGTDEINADKADYMAKKFFHQSYSSLDIESTTLRDGVWFVRVIASLFGRQSNQTLAIEAKTGNIISVD